jgi:hypothetical protein
MEHIGKRLDEIERNMKLEGFDRITAGGCFTQVPNVIQNDPNLELGEKAVYASSAGDLARPITTPCTPRSKPSPPITGRPDVSPLTSGCHGTDLLSSDG